MEIPPVVIIDNGSGYLKAGFSNDLTPKITIPSMVGRQMLRYGEQINFDLDNESKKSKIKFKEIMIGDEVTPYRSLLELSHPLYEGVIQNPDDLHKLWEYTLTKKLKINDLSEKKIILTEAPMNPINNKIKIFDILFGQLQVKAVNIEPQAKCSLFCEGMDTGVVIDSGDGVTQCIPISDGTILKYHIERLNLGGRHITEYLIRLLQRKGYAFNSSADFDLVREIKEKFCFVSNDIKSDRELDRTTSFFNSFYLLPDETRIHLSNEKFEAPEILFHPEYIGRDEDGIHEMVFKSIFSCPIDTRVGLYNNMVLSGASTLFPGFPTRFENEMKILFKNNDIKLSKKGKVNISVIDNPKRSYSAFSGASIIANYYNNNTSNDYWITINEWLDCDEDIGKKEKIIKEKCQSYFKDGANEKKKQLK